MEGMIGEIRLFAGNFAPKNWSFCNGATIQIASNTALFSILGTTYGGNGTTNFLLPNLMSRTAVGAGNGPGLPSVALGQAGGTETTTLTQASMPAHTHVAAVNANSASSTAATPAGQYPAGLTTRIAAGGYTLRAGTYGNAVDGAPMAANMVTLSPSGSNAPFSTLNPYLGMNYVICMYGIYPSRG
jgi:microcystin-dependent protein